VVLCDLGFDADRVKPMALSDLDALFARLPVRDVES
jgi:hypothetical protein